MYTYWHMQYNIYLSTSVSWSNLLNCSQVLLFLFHARHICGDFIDESKFISVIVCFFVRVYIKHHRNPHRLVRSTGMGLNFLLRILSKSRLSPIIKAAICNLLNSKLQLWNRFDGTVSCNRVNGLSLSASDGNAASYTVRLRVGYNQPILYERPSCAKTPFNAQPTTEQWSVCLKTLIMDSGESLGFLIVRLGPCMCVHHLLYALRLCVCDSGSVVRRMFPPSWLSTPAGVNRLCHSPAILYAEPH